MARRWKRERFLTRPSGDPKKASPDLCAGSSPEELALGELVAGNIRNTCEPVTLNYVDSVAGFWNLFLRLYDWYF